MVGLQLLLVAFFFCATNAVNTDLHVGRKVADSRISSYGALSHRHGISPGESLGIGPEQWLRQQAVRRAAARQAAVECKKKKKKKE
jgi:hypothetical protein